MDLNEYWQENKRFLVATASGVVVFLAGMIAIDRAFRGELLALQRSASSASAKLRNEPMYGPDALDKAQKDNEELKKTVGILTEATAFKPRPGFRLDPKAGPATNQYFSAVSRVREELLRAAGRGNLRIPDDLGPALAPTREAEIERYLEALDLVDRAVRLALEAGVSRSTRSRSGSIRSSRRARASARSRRRASRSRPSASPRPSCTSRPRRRARPGIRVRCSWRRPRSRSRVSPRTRPCCRRPSSRREWRGARESEPPMKPRKEHVVLAATVLLLGWMAWQSRGEGVVRGSGGKKAAAPELEKHAVPDATLVLPSPRDGDRPPPRDLFSPPSDTHPLPPLAIQPIPLAPLAMLAPPPVPGPMPALYGNSCGSSGRSGAGPLCPEGPSTESGRRGSASGRPVEGRDPPVVGPRAAALGVQEALRLGPHGRDQVRRDPEPEPLPALAASERGRPLRRVQPGDREAAPPEPGARPALADARDGVRFRGHALEPDREAPRGARRSAVRDAVRRGPRR